MARIETKFAGYLEDFDLSVSKLQDKRVLDLGAGVRLFGLDCELAGIGPVFSADIETVWWHRWSLKLGKFFSDDETMWQAWKWVDKKSLAAAAQALPFVDQSIDLILARSMIPEKDLIESVLSEVVRVLAPGGEAIFYPAWMEFWESSEKRAIEAAVEKIVFLGGVEISWEPIFFAETGRSGKKLKIKRQEG